MGQKSKVVGIVAGLVVALAVIFGLAAITKDKPPQTTTPAQNNQVQQASKKAVTYKGIEGKNALELLKQTHKVETKNYQGLGEMVTSIDGVAPDSKHFWALYVNGQQAQVGAGVYVTKSSDVIAWKLEVIQ